MVHGTWTVGRIEVRGNCRHQAADLAAAEIVVAADPVKARFHDAVTFEAVPESGSVVAANDRSFPESAMGVS